MQNKPSLQLCREHSAITGHILGHQPHAGKPLRIHSIASTVFGHKGINLGMNVRRNIAQEGKYWEKIKQHTQIFLGEGLDL